MGVYALPVAGKRNLREEKEGRKEDGRIKGRLTKANYMNNTKQERRGGLNPSSTPKLS